MPTYTVIGFEKDGFDTFTKHANADDPRGAAKHALQDEFIKRTGRPAPNTEALAQLEDKTGLFITGIVEGEHDNLDILIDHHEAW
jgi:hypothetical protein